MIIDAHAHIGKFISINRKIDFEEALKLADRMGIDKLFCTHVLALYYHFEEGNAEVLRAIKRYPERILGYVSISSPRHGEELLGHLDRCILEDGFHGIKIYSHPRGVFGETPFLSITDEYMHPVLTRASAWRVPVLAHAASWECAQVCEKFPALRLIQAHMGATPCSLGDWHTAIATAHNHPNLLLDTTTSCCDLGMVEEAVRVLGHERVVWGSDIPMLDPWMGIEKIRCAEISEEARTAILGDNIMRLVGEGQETVRKIKEGRL